MQVRTPDQILQEIVQVRQELVRGADALFEQELAAERAEDHAQLEFDRVFMVAEGAIPDRQAVARGASVEARDAAFVARAALNRVKAKIRALDASLVSLQAELKWVREVGA